MFWVFHSIVVWKKEKKKKMKKCSFLRLLAFFCAHTLTPVLLTHLQTQTHGVQAVGIVGEGERERERASARAGRQRERSREKREK